MKRSSYNLFLFILLSFSSSQFVYAESSLTITSGKGEPFVNSAHTGFYDLIVKNMFERINVEARTIVLPSERSLINANAGIDDGNIARIKGIEKKYTNLVRVPGKIIDFDFVAFTKSKNLPVSNWQSLQPYNVAFINGWKVFEKKVKHYKSLVRTQDTKQLFELLNKNRVDIALYDLWSGLWWTNQFSTNAQYIEPPIARFELYLYIHKKHSSLRQGLSIALEEMKKDGTYRRIFEQTLTKLKK